MKPVDRTPPTPISPLRPKGARGARPDATAGGPARAGANAAKVVLLCNPLAGGRWRVLAEVLDSPEARLVRRIVTDEIDDVREALGELGRRIDLLCIYGGDGTIFRVLDQLALTSHGPLPRLALLGGGTMNVTARSCGMSSSPAENFRAVMRAYVADRLVWRDVPLLEIQDGGRVHHGFTFGIGPLVRLLVYYETTRKGLVRAAALGARSIGSALLGRDLGGASLREASATVRADGVTLPFDRFSSVFCNTTGTINPHVYPFVGDRSRDSFHFLAYAGSSRSFALLAPLLARGKLPADPDVVRRPISAWRHGLLSYVAAGELPLDPRYVNHPAREVEITTDESHYTIDGEILPVTGPLTVRLGPSVQLAMLEPRRLLRGSP